MRQNCRPRKKLGERKYRMPVELASIQGLWPVLKRIPGLIAFGAKWYFTPERLASLVYVDVFPRHESARVDLGQVSTFQFFLQIINLSPFELELDRANFSLSCGGVRLDSIILKKEQIPSGASIKLFVYGSVPDGHANQIAISWKGNPVSIDGNIEFNSVVRSFPRRVGYLDGVQLSVINDQHRRKVA